MTLTGAHAWTVGLCNSCIVVMAGRWIMFDNGAWDFKIDNDRMGRAVDSSRIRGAEELKTCILAAYGLLGREVSAEMSYWLNDGESEMQIEECYKRNSQSGGMRNVQDKYKGLQQKAMVGRAGEAFIVSEFKEIMELIKLTDWRCWDYLEKIDKKLWTRSHFEGERFNVMTSNAAESLNNALLSARDSPIMALFEFIRRKLCTWYVSRRSEISKMKGNVPDNIQKILVEQLVLSTGLLVMPCSTWLFEVTHRPTNFGSRLIWINELALASNSKSLVCHADMPLLLLLTVICSTACLFANTISKRHGLKQLGVSYFRFRIQRMLKCQPEY
ncbi:unnamed protein product [Brassica rapa subsp. trilocularis]